MDDSSDEKSDVVLGSTERGVATNKDSVQVDTKGGGELTGTSPSTQRIIKSQSLAEILPHR